MHEKEYYFVRLLGTRPGWPEDMTDKESAIMQKHYDYLKDLTARKKVVIAGPVFGNVFGLIILRVDSKDEALEIMNNEPSVTGGVHKYEMSPMKASLLMHHVSSDRYATEPSDRILRKEVIVPASIDEVWKAWTTTDGVGSFFSPDALVDLRLGGPFEIYFNLEAPYGQRGSEDCKILSFVPKKMLSFEWNAPPAFGPLRDKRTQVIIRFDEIEPGKVKVDFTQLGWGRGKKWDELYDYFNNAWSSVLGNLKKHFSQK